jgi:hypothetical protein
MHRLLLISGALVLGACIENEDRSTDFEYLHAAIIEPSCATIGCHSAATEQGPPGYLVNLSTPSDACCSLTGSNCDDTDAHYGNWTGLTDGVPDLILLLRGTYYEPGTEDYPRMPVDRPLPEADIELLQRWLAGGAQCE